MVGQQQGWPPQEWQHKQQEFSDFSIFAAPLIFAAQH
jgi:hypothetical protein